MLLSFASGYVLGYRARWLAPVASALAIVVGLVSYAAFMHMHYGLSYHNVAGSRLGRWLPYGAVIGLVVGLDVVLARSRLAVLGWALLAAFPLAEMRVVGGWSLDKGSSHAVLDCLAGLSLIVLGCSVLAMRRVPWLLGPLTALAWALGYLLIGGLPHHGGVV